ncbi:MAG: hypothetical protein PVG78_19125 [Desulfobacterales bacterium]
MGRCVRHPDRETPYRCMKHELYMCEECLHCRDPEIYCKFRPSCAIHFMEKNGDLPHSSAPEVKKAANQGG